MRAACSPVRLGTVILALSLVALALPVQGSGTVVVATIKPLADLASTLLGPGVEVHYIIKPGFDPHTYQLTREDLGLLREADVFLYLGLEPFLKGSMDALREDCVRIELMESLSRISEKGGLHGSWLLPENLASMAEEVARVLQPRFPQVSRNLESLLSELEELEGRLRVIGSRMPYPGYIAAVPGVVYQLLAMGVPEEAIFLLSRAPDLPPSPPDRERAEELASEGYLVVSAMSQRGVGPADQAAELIASDAGAQMVRIALLQPWDDMDVLELILFNAYVLLGGGQGGTAPEASPFPLVAGALSVLVAGTALIAGWGRWRH